MAAFERMRPSLHLLALAVAWLTVATAAHATPVMRIQPGTVKPGDPVLVTLEGVKVTPEGKIGKRALHFYRIKGGFQAITALSVEREPGEVEIKVALPKSIGPEAPPELIGIVEVADPHFPSRELKVANKFTEKPPPAVQKRIEEDRAAFAAAFAQPFRARVFEHNFAWPRPPLVTAPFGDLRLFNGKKQSQHYGTDLDGKVGEPIFASNDGVVVMARDCYASGNTVLLFHGASLYTAYFHMSEIRVKEGDTVQQGALLGLVGKTGRVTGPHLHWGVKIEGMYVDGTTLLKLDFE